VIKEQLLLTDVVTLDLPVTAAENQIQINAIDQFGDHLVDNFQWNLLHLCHAKSGFGVIFNYVYGIDLFTTAPHFSDFSEDYFFEYTLDCHPSPGQSYQFFDRIKGLHDDIISRRSSPIRIIHYLLAMRLRTGAAFSIMKSMPLTSSITTVVFLWIKCSA